MSEHHSSNGSSTRDLLSKVTRYEALFELTGAINAATDLEAVAEVLARRIKYVADVYSWRYLCFPGNPDEAEGPQPAALVVDGFRGRAEVTRIARAALSHLEADLWEQPRTQILCGDAMTSALEELPEHFGRDDLEQIAINALTDSGGTRALLLFAKRRQPFSELDLKCLTMLGGFFHAKIDMLWHQQQLRELEVAYLQQEAVLRENEKLATLGRLSAGMAHELNNPASAARQSAEQLGAAISRLEQARFALGAANLSAEQLDRISELEAAVRERAAAAESLDPLARGDLEEAVEDWLEEQGLEESWEHASSLVALGLCVEDLEALMRPFDAAEKPLVLDYLGARFASDEMLREIGRGTQRVAEIIEALKGYSFMDQGAVQAVDVGKGLQDTLAMLRPRLADGIDVRLELAETLPTIQGSGGELNQVWTHLIDNALAAMGETGTLELRAYEEDGWVVVEVTDSGQGIPRDVVDKIFDPFFTTKPPGEGAGLGLNISHGIVVERHHGQISVDSMPGATRFEVRLPLEGSPAIEAPSR